uniref:Uncharacterized protein n=1 Tax=Chromera velia CCMP2878 TaxID=1169474 RepID=A0A0G4G4Q7_9ALVE|eukprot:Cvel_4147.t1-p1 / transcript=Cvel_4147.t1 / gene=Cvel_4147 / organism=Chromera_velia_CCMP2878 / gene_product=hypothetical protein / transcript_product=hypothetical protein / location=Cvel_scaffold178:7881-8156(+) / protein_length=92 / sequence_SO=supercontig / SO=protein_coding / is_pseudo=false
MLVAQKVQQGEGGNRKSSSPETSSLKVCAKPQAHMEMQIEVERGVKRAGEVLAVISRRFLVARNNRGGQTEGHREEGGTPEKEFCVREGDVD